MAQALLIKTTGEVELTTVPEEGGHLVLNELCGGWIDCVRTEDIVGYVNDEGILIGLAPNALASLLFGRPLVGDVVVLGALNDEGDYDGENHDVPEQYDPTHLETISKALLADENVMKALVLAVEEVLSTPPTVTAFTDEEFDAWLNGKGE
jgi:hypothetical protein